MAEEKDLMDVFKNSNGLGTDGASPDFGDDDGNIPFKDLDNPDQLEGTDDGDDNGGDAEETKNNVGINNKNIPDSDEFNDNEGPGDYSEEIISSLFSAIIEPLGIEGAELPKTPEELIDKLSGIISESAKPKYSSPISEEFDMFISNGGAVEDFILKYTDGIDILPSIATEEGKISAIRQVLADAGFSDERIEKRIEKYLDNDTLEEEAKDALDVLAEKRNAKIKERAAVEKEAKIARDEEAKTFFKSVEAEIGKLTTIRGIKPTVSQLKELSEYCLKVDKKDGLTAFQRDYAKSPVMNFIETAFFTKYGNAVIKAAEGAGSSNAIEKFKSSLKQTKIAGTSGPQNGKGAQISDWVKLASQFSGRK